MVDIDGSGVIYFEEFLQLLEMQIQDDLFFNVFNRSRSGEMTQEELRNGMMTLGHRLGDEEIDGKLTFDEFRGMLERVQTEEKAVSKRGWDHEGAMRVFELWAIILAEQTPAPTKEGPPAPKLAEKNSLMKKCEKPAREIRRSSSRIAQPKTRRVAATQKALQPEIGSASDGAQAVYTEPVVINIEDGDPQKRPKIECNCKGPAVILRAKRCYLENFEIVNHGAGPAISVRLKEG
eukprot:gene7040-57093_t